MKYIESKYSKFLKEATRLKKQDIQQAIEYINKALDEVSSLSLEHKLSGIKKLTSYMQINGDFTKAMKILHDYYSTEIKNVNNFNMRAMNGSLLIGHMGTIMKKNKVDYLSIDEQSSYLHFIALACQGRWSKSDNSEYLERVMNKGESYERYINFLNENSKSLSLFNSVGDKFFFEPNKYIKEWQTNKKINDYYNSIIDKINNNINSKLDELI